MFCECDSGYQMIDCQRNGFPSGIVPVGRGYSPSSGMKGPGPSVYCSCPTPGPLVCQMMSPEAIMQGIISFSSSLNETHLAENSRATISPPAYGVPPPMAQVGPGRSPNLPNNSSSINIPFYGPTYDYYGDYHYDYHYYKQ